MTTPIAPLRRIAGAVRRRLISRAGAGLATLRFGLTEQLRTTRIQPIMAQHLFLDLPHYVIEGYIFDHDTLFISFIHDFAKPQPNVFAPGWSSHFFRRQQTSHLCIRPKVSDWYQADGLSQALADLRTAGFFQRFRRRITYGSSMGGFAALAFADQVEATDVLAVSPQTTMDRNLIPWEPRFPAAPPAPWTGPNADSVGKSRKARRVWAVYDPFCRLDKRHILRLRQDNLRHVPALFLGHGMIPYLTQIKAMNPLLDAIRSDSDDLTGYFRRLRRRRQTERYWTRLMGDARARDNPARMAIITAHHRKWREAQTPPGPGGPQAGIKTLA